MMDARQATAPPESEERTAGGPIATRGVVRAIARKEMTETLRDGRFRWAALVVALLLTAALAMSWRQYRAASRERAEATRQARDIWVNQGAKDPHAAAHFGTFAFKPRSPLTLLDQGIEPYVGAAIYLEAHKMNNARYLPAQDRTSLQRFGELTAAMALQLLLPLLIILLSFSAIAGEREAGTLRQVASLGVRPGDLALGKALGIGAGLACLVVPAVAAGVVATSFMTAADGTPSGVPRLALLVLVYLVYFAAILAASLLVSAVARSSRAALVVLLGFWCWNGLVAPRLSADLARAAYPTPTAAEFEEAVHRGIMEGVNGHDPADRRRKEFEARVLKQYGVGKVEDLPINFSGLALQLGEDSSNAVWDRQYGLLWGAYADQQRLVQWSSLFAPLLAVRSLSMSLAGTDFAHHRDFAEAAEDYRRRMVKTLNEDLAYHSRHREKYLANRSLWESIPDFAYATPPVARALAGQGIGSLVLLLWAGGGALLAWRAARNLEVV